MKSKLYAFIRLVCNTMLFLITIYWTIQITNFIWVHNDQNELYYKYFEPSWITQIYNDYQIETRNCNSIKHNITALVSYSPTFHDDFYLNKIIGLTKHCDKYKDDYQFLISLNNDKLSLTHHENKNLEIITYYWHFIPQKHKNNLEDYFQKENQEIIKLLREEFITKSY